MSVIITAHHPKYCRLRTGVHKSGTLLYGRCRRFSQSIVNIFSKGSDGARHVTWHKSSPTSFKESVTFCNNQELRAKKLCARRMPF